MTQEQALLIWKKLWLRRMPKIEVRYNRLYFSDTAYSVGARFWLLLLVLYHEGGNISVTYLYETNV